jgi:hypothetical protein
VNPGTRAGRARVSPAIAGDLLFIALISGARRRERQS